MIIRDWIKILMCKWSCLNRINFFLKYLLGKYSIFVSFLPSCQFFPLMRGHMLQFCSASLKVWQKLQKNSWKRAWHHWHSHSYWMLEVSNDKCHPWVLTSRPPVLNSDIHAMFDGIKIEMEWTEKVPSLSIASFIIETTRINNFQFSNLLNIVVYYFH